ncbi:MAG: hypothetical protein LIO79_06995 [Rikenellaceae bacterium]|nr:hypothetical protein [Rikenellaceae bacterium]
MKEIIIYIIKCGLCLGLFLCIYQLFLRRNNSLIFNRIFLIAGYAVSLVLPAVVLKYNVVLPVALLEDSIYDNLLFGEFGLVETDDLSRFPVEPGNIGNVWDIIGFIYICGILWCLCREGLMVFRVNKLIRNGNKYRLGNCTLVENCSVPSPFSIVKYIFLNPQRLSPKEKELIIEHETSHIRQKHWMDLILSECMLMLMWFNPFIWFYIKVQKENHEFLADREVLSKGFSFILYRAVLVNQQFGRPVFSFSNSFNQPDKLNRLEMMKKKTITPWRKFAAMIAVMPVIGIFLFLSAKPNYVNAQETAVDTNNTYVINIDGVDHEIAMEPEYESADPLKNIFIDGVAYDVADNTLPNIIEVIFEEQSEEEIPEEIQMIFTETAYIDNPQKMTGVDDPEDLPVFYGTATPITQENRTRDTTIIFITDLDIEGMDYMVRSSRNETVKATEARAGRETVREELPQVQFEAVRKETKTLREGLRSGTNITVTDNNGEIINILSFYDQITNNSAYGKDREELIKIMTRLREEISTMNDLNPNLDSLMRKMKISNKMRKEINKLVESTKPVINEAIIEEVTEKISGMDTLVMNMDFAGTAESHKNIRVTGSFRGKKVIYNIKSTEESEKEFYKFLEDIEPTFDRGFQVYIEDGQKWNLLMEKI